jgi:hypothetical protein
MSGHIGILQAVGSISIVKSNGTAETVFDSAQTALNCLAFMPARNQYYMMRSDDIMIFNKFKVKLLFLDTTFLNQKFMKPFILLYIQGEVMGVHRNLLTILNLTDVLVSVGCKRSSPANFANKWDLQEARPNPERPHIQIVDVDYRSVVSTSADGSQLNDNVQLMYPYMYDVKAIKKILQTVFTLQL